MKDYSCKLVKQSEFEHDDRKKKRTKIYEKIETDVKFMLKETN